MKLRWPMAQHLYLSPHPDDAVLSCGGMIWQQVNAGESVAVVTIFAASPSPSWPLSDFAAGLHQRWQHSALRDADFTDPPAVRREEDAHALAVLSPNVLLAHFPLTDCVYRAHPVTGQPLYPSEDAIFGAVHPADPAVAELSILPPLPSNSYIYSPLGIGEHVDHQIVRSLVDGWGLDAGQVRYYEDYPYVLHEGALEVIVGQHDGWVSVTMPLSKAALEAKIDAVAQHKSQISTFWKGDAEMATALSAHAAALGGERLWIRAGIP